MRRFTMLLAFFSALLIAPAVPVGARRYGADSPPPSALEVAPAPPAFDAFPNLPPLSELARLPSADIAAHWSKIQRPVVDDALAKSNDRTLSRQLQSRYEDIAFETGKRRLWVNKIRGAHDAKLPEHYRRHCLSYLQGMDAYWSGRWPPPVPVELIDEVKKYDTKSLFLQSIADLPARYRDVFVLAEADGLTIAEIAAKVGDSESEVKHRLYEARVLLGQALVRRYDEAQKK